MKRIKSFGIKISTSTIIKRIKSFGVKISTSTIIKRIKSFGVKISTSTIIENKPLLFLYILYTILIVLVIYLSYSLDIYKSKAQLEQKSISILKQKITQSETENRNLQKINSSIYRNDIK